jgi:hypothetical protein
MNSTLSDFNAELDYFENTYITLYIILMILLSIILLVSIWANKEYNQYLRFLLLAITRIKVEEIDVELKRLQTFMRVLTDTLTPWISQDLYQLYFNLDVE